jgi:chemotaxis signal transduction protein
MSKPAEAIADRAAELRRAFDRSFAEPAVAATADGLDLIAIRVAGVSYAARLDQIGGVHVDIPTTPVPSPTPWFLGLAAFRSVLTPVFDLGLVLGSAGTPAPRWMLLEATTRIGLAFEAFERHLAVSAAAVARPRQEEASRHVGAVVRLEGRVFPIIDLASVAAVIRSQVPRSLHKEQ